MPGQSPHKGLVWTTWHNKSAPSKVERPRQENSNDDSVSATAHRDLNASLRPVSLAVKIRRAMESALNRPPGGA